VFAAGPNRTRLDRFVEKLEHQHIEVERTTKATKLARAHSWNGTEVKDVAIPAGSVLVQTNQPLKQLVDAILEFDVRIPTSFLKTEKKDILARDDSRLYDTTGWSLSLAYGLDAYVVDGVPGVDKEKFVIADRKGSLSNDAAKVGFAFDGRDDRALELLARLFDNGIKVWCSKKPFHAGDTVMARGSFLVRRAGNPNLDAAKLRALADAAGVEVIGVDGGLATGEFADLGGNDFALGGTAHRHRGRDRNQHDQLRRDVAPARQPLPPARVDLDIANVRHRSVEVQRDRAAGLFGRHRRVQGSPAEIGAR
jgi:hypothetical protein